MKMENEHIAAINHFDERNSNINGSAFDRSLLHQLDHAVKSGPMVAYFDEIQIRLDQKIVLTPSMHGLKDLKRIRPGDFNERRRHCFLMGHWCIGPRLK